MRINENPGYIDLIVGMYEGYFSYSNNEKFKDYSFPQSFLDDFKRYYHVESNEYLEIFYLSIFFTLFRYAFEYFICKVNKFRFGK